MDVLVFQANQLVGQLRNSKEMLGRRRLVPEGEKDDMHAVVHDILSSRQSQDF